MSAALSSLPSIVSLILAIVVVNAVAYAIYAGVRSIALRRQFKLIGIGPWASTIGSFCALLFSFTIVTLWSANRETYSAINDEAVAARMVARDIPQTQLPLIRAYVQASVDEWPALCGGGDFSKSGNALEALLQQATPRAGDMDADLFRQLSALETLRMQRIRASGSSIPIELWIGLIAMSIALFAVLSLGLLENSLHYAILMAVFATAVAVLLWVAALLDFPYCGGTAVQSPALIDTLRLIQ